MAHVSENSFRTLFTVSLLIILLTFVIFIFYYNQFRKVENNELDRQDVTVTKNLSLIFVALMVVAIVVITILFFGLPRWLKHRHYNHHH